MTPGDFVSLTHESKTYHINIHYIAYAVDDPTLANVQIILRHGNALNLSRESALPLLAVLARRHGLTLAGHGVEIVPEGAQRIELTAPQRRALTVTKESLL